jgi:hypothetical protein
MALNIDGRRIKVGAASVIASSTKQPSDAWHYIFDLADWLEGEDTILSATVSATPTGGSHITVAVAGLSPTTVKVLVSLGVDTTRYTITVRATTVGGQIKEAELSLLVLEYPTVGA